VKVLVLSPYPECITGTLERAGDTPILHNDSVGLDFLHRHGIDYGVSYGYRTIIREPVLSALSERLINLHIAYLPWNRGQDANLWSWLEDTPKGVSIHYIDAGVDTGDVLTQRETAFSDDETLATSYEKLRRDMEALFEETWPAIRDGKIRAKPQTGNGSVHRKKDSAAILNRLPLGWDTPVAMLKELDQR
jgi:methionyl-tRNA formyltransferase